MHQTTQNSIQCSRVSSNDATPQLACHSN